MLAYNSYTWIKAALRKTEDMYSQGPIDTPCIGEKANNFRPDFPIKLWHCVNLIQFNSIKEESIQVNSISFNFCSNRAFVIWYLGVSTRRNGTYDHRIQLQLFIFSLVLYIFH